VTLLTEFFGKVPADSLRIADIPRYKAWRVRRLRFGTGDRTVDKDIQTLSNILNYGVAMGIIAFNYLRAGRPRYQRADRIRHAREVAPTDAGVIHRLADEFFTEIRSEVLGWQLLFAMFTGCRTSELLRLRVDAADVTAAGFRAGDRLFLGRRSKGGVNPWAMVGPEFGRMLECFDRWHAARHPGCPWYFPTPNGGHAPVNPGALGHALTRIGTQLRIPHITPHGLRSFYVTKRRSDGAADTVIAGEIGDKTVALMQTTYGARPENWTGGAALSWLPSVGLPAWDRWQSAAAKIVSL
jgi:integrase